MTHAFPKAFRPLTVGDYKSLLERTDAKKNRGMEFGRLFHEAVDAGEMHEKQFSLQACFEACCGRDGLNSIRPDLGGGTVIQEDAVDSTTFANITGQIVYTTMMRGWMQGDGGVFDALFSVTPTRFDGEKIPGVGVVQDEDFTVVEGMEIPLSGYAEHYLTTPSTVHKAMRVAVTREAVFFDRTGQVLTRASQIGDRLQRGRLKDCMRVLTGITNNFNWNGTAYNTYRATATPTATGWYNTTTAAAGTLTDYTDLDLAYQYLNLNLHPDTGEALEVMPQTLVVVPQLRLKAHTILNGTHIEQGAVSATVPVMRVPTGQVIHGDITLVVSGVMQQLLDSEGGYSTANSKTAWIYGNPKTAMTWMENWPLQVRRAPAGNLDEHKRGIIADYAASHRGVAAMLHPWELFLGATGTA